ncbi:MAG TPA: hypothetical protein VGD60_09955 [Candidatus Acidoferrales bacterium]
MNDKILQAVWEDAARLDDLLFTLGDTLDVKASIVLVLATLLGAVTGSILALDLLAPWVKLAQAVAVLGIFCTVVFCLVALWPSTFGTPPGVEGWEGFVTELAGDYKDDPHGLDAVLLELQGGRLGKAKQRIAINRKLTKRKAKFNKYAFYGSAVVILMDALTLAWLAHARL